jgi:hypothetical protein
MYRQLAEKTEDAFIKQELRLWKARPSGFPRNAMCTIALAT